MPVVVTFLTYARYVTFHPVRSRFLHGNGAKNLSILPTERGQRVLAEMAHMQQQPISNFFVKKPSISGNLDQVPNQKRKHEDSNSRPPEKRKLKQSWFFKYKWLKHVAEKKILICTWCIDVGRSNTFTTGKSSLCPKADDISKHEKSMDHKFASEVKIAVEAREMPRAMSKVCEKMKDAIVSTMKNVYFICKENIAKEKLLSLQELIIHQGCTQVQLLKLEDRLRYTHHECVEDFIYAIKTVIENDVLGKIKSAKFYSLEIDGSTDVSNCQNLMIYIRAVVEGKVVSHFLSLVQLDEGCTADKIYRKVVDVLNEKGLPISSLIALGTDGASTMTGCRGGLVTLFKNENPFIISEHCAAHRLALASGQAADAVPYLIKYQAIINDIHKCYKYSPKNSNVLRNAQNVLGAKVLKFKQVFHTRWLSFYSSVKTILESIDPLLSALQTDVDTNKNNARALGLQKSIGKFQFVATTHFLVDALGPLYNTCLAFQSSELLFSDVLDNLESCQYALTNMIDGDRLNLQQCKNLREFLCSLPENYKNEIEVKFKSHDITVNSKQIQTVFTTAVNFLKIVINNIQQRYSTDKVCSLFDIFSPVKLPAEQDLLLNYGNEEIRQLGDMFGHQKVNSSNINIPAIIDPDELLVEWQSFKYVIYKHKNLTVKDFWCITMKKYNECGGFKNILETATIGLTCPMTTTNVERGFSKQNIIKTALRNNIKTKNLSDLIFINSEGPDMKNFNFDLAFECWCTSKNRHLPGLYKD